MRASMDEPWGEDAAAPAPSPAPRPKAPSSHPAASRHVPTTSDPLISSEKAGGVGPFSLQATCTAMLALYLEEYVEALGAALLLLPLNCRAALLAIARCGAPPGSMRARRVPVVTSAQALHVQHSQLCFFHYHLIQYNAIRVTELIVVFVLGGVAS